VFFVFFISSVQCVTRSNIISEMTNRLLGKKYCRKFNMGVLFQIWDMLSGSSGILSLL
jgi:hypothetical protein